MTDDGSGRVVKLHSFLVSKSDGEQLKQYLPCSSGTSKPDPCSDDEEARLNIGFGLGINVRANYGFL
jgi:hypothetical protein